MAEDLLNVVTLTESSQYNGTYRNVNKPGQATQSYYLNGNVNGPALHFTVVNNPGGVLKRFHETWPIPDSGFYLRSNYYYNQGSWTVAWDGCNFSEIPQRERAIAEQYFTTNGQAMFEAAEEFAWRVQGYAARPSRSKTWVRVPAPALALSVPAPPPAERSRVTPAEPPDIPIMSQAHAVGQGFNIYGEFNTRSLIRPLFDYNKGGTQVFTFLGKEYRIPSFMTALQNTSSYYSGGACETREQIQDSFAAHAGVAASFGAFSGEMQADFATQFEDNSMYAYAYNDFYTQLAYIELNPGAEHLNDEFVKRVADLPAIANETTLPAFEAFFEEFGIYYTQKIVLGGQSSFLVAVDQSSQLSSADISAMVKANYNALVYSGSLDAEVAASETWHTYTSNSQTVIKGVGGDPTALAALVAINPLQPSTDTVSAFQAWVQSITTAPAIVDFTLKGIWELCGDKAGVVQTAWQLFGRKMHPRLMIDTTSQVMPSTGPHTPNPPIINISGLSGPIQPSSPPSGACGFQLLILDGKDLTGASAVLLDKYYTLPDNEVWWNLYQGLYESIQADILSSGFDGGNNVLVLASFGLDNNMPPPASFYSLLQSAGAGAKLRYWEDHCDPGSEVGPDDWINFPANYILVGVFGGGPDAGIEAYAVTPGSSVTTSLDVYFYRDWITGQYSLGPGH